MDAAVQLIQSLIVIFKNPVTWYIFGALMGYWIFSAAVGALDMPPPRPKDGPDPWARSRYWFRFLNQLAGNLHRAAKALHVPGEDEDQKAEGAKAAGSASMGALLLALGASLVLLALPARAQTSMQFTTVKAKDFVANAGGATGVDFRVAAHSLPVKVGTDAAKPATCTVGEMYISTDLSPAGQQVSFCTATNTWTRGINNVTGYTWSALQTFSAGVTVSGGAFDASAAASTRVTIGTGVPAGANCNASGMVGKLYVRSDTQATNGSLYVCSQTGAGTFAWELAQPTGSGVTSFNSRTGAVNPASADYTAAQVTNAFDKSASNTVAAGTQDFTGAAHTLPVKTGTTAAKPGTCTVGEIYFANDATAGKNLYMCTATNTFTQMTAATPTDVQVFTGSGTWTKPTGAKSTTVLMVGGGGGGGSGRRGAASTARGGGSGGGGAAFSVATFSSAVLGATETVTVGGGGGGAAAIAVDSTNGSNGTAGTASSFGNWLRAAGGGAGQGGTTVGGPAAAAGSVGSGGCGGDGGLGSGGASGAAAGGAGGNCSSGNPFLTFSAGTGDASASFTFAGLSMGAGGGGGGGGISATNVISSAGAGGQGALPHNTTLTGGTTGGTTVVGGNGTSAATNEAIGGAGGGGGSANGAANNAGGNGGIYGAGGGGGGGSLNAANSGAGGAGAGGIVIVITTF